MKPLSRHLTSATVLALVVGSAGLAQAQTSPATSRAPRSVDHGRIAGRVSDESGAPVAGVVVSVIGTTATIGMSDAAGRFVVERLVPGTYVVRAHLPGFASAQRETREVSAGSTAEASLMLRRVGGSVGVVNALGNGEPRAVITAGVGSADQPGPAPATSEPALAAGEPAPAAGEPAPAAGDTRSASRSVDDNHSETTWLLRHLKRSVLKDTVDRTSLADEPGAETAFAEARAEPGRFASALFADLPLSGQINLLTMSAFDSPQQLFTNPAPLGVAFISLGAPVGDHASWAVNGVMTQGDVASWILAGSYVSKWPDAHVIELGLSYGTQRYQGGNAAALAAVTDGNRNVGSVHAFDEWRVSERVTLEYGTRYARYDYVPGPGLLSPRASLTFTLEPSTRVRASARQRMTAPGAEEFLPPIHSGLWLPPERTFAPIVSGASFEAERARHVEIALEHGKEWVIGVRRFAEEVDNQIVNVFGVRGVHGPRTELGHYFVANAGHAETSGWGVSLSRPVASRLRGSVSYTVTNARWRPTVETALLAVIAPSATQRLESERFHDVTTSLEADFPETASRVCVIYKVNTAFSRPQVENPRPGPDVRFDVQVNQALPFLRFTNTKWEVLVAVRNLFHDSGTLGSVYDELMVIRPPKRIVGGLTVRF